MSSQHNKLSKVQENFIATLNEGPQILDPDVFEGPIDRIMLGLKAHANTISHARLIALEESFPMTREELGHDIFNAISRDYIELDHVKAHDNAQLGLHFEQYIRPKYEAHIADLAAIEWAWLESYNAAEANSLSLEQLSEFDEDTLISQHVIWHPSLRVIPLSAPIAQPLAELRDICIDPHSILVTRDNVEVRLLPINDVTAKIVWEAKYKTPMGNLLEIATELGDMDNPLQPLLSIIGAGALICIG